MLDVLVDLNRLIHDLVGQSRAAEKVKSSSSCLLGEDA
jgi:hypothetical protein